MAVLVIVQVASWPSVSETDVAVDDAAPVHTQRRRACSRSGPVSASVYWPTWTAAAVTAAEPVAPLIDTGPVPDSVHAVAGVVAPVVPLSTTLTSVSSGAIAVLVIVQVALSPGPRVTVFAPGVPPDARPRRRRSSRPDRRTRPARSRRPGTVASGHGGVTGGAREVRRAGRGQRPVGRRRGAAGRGRVDHLDQGQLRGDRGVGDRAGRVLALGQRDRGGRSTSPRRCRPSPRRCSRWARTRRGCSVPTWTGAGGDGGRAGRAADGRRARGREGPRGRPAWWRRSCRCRRP